MGILWEQKNATVIADLCTNIPSVSVKKKVKDNTNNDKDVNKNGKG